MWECGKFPDFVLTRNNRPEKNVMGLLCRTYEEISRFPQKINFCITQFSQLERIAMQQNIGQRGRASTKSTKSHLWPAKDMSICPYVRREKTSQASFYIYDEKFEYLKLTSLFIGFKWLSIATIRI